MKKILIAEDDANIRNGLVDLYEGEGFQVVAAADGAEALRQFSAGCVDLILLDVMMPELSGYDVCRKIRKTDSAVPIIMLTAKSEEIDKVVGLQLGADDYVTKPFGVHELLARTEAVLRRASRGTSEPAEAPSAFDFGPARIDGKTYTATCQGTTFSLSSREMDLLCRFHRSPGEVLSRNMLLDDVWGVNYFGSTRTLDQHISQLRKKIEPNASHPVVIQTVHGIGYKYEPTAETQE